MSAEQKPLEPPESDFRYARIQQDADGTAEILVQLPDGTCIALAMPHAKRVHGADIESLD
jgi:hypothetical protein